MAIATNPPQVNSVRNLPCRLANIILSDADRRILTAGASGNIELVPSDPIVCRDRDAVHAYGRTNRAGRVGDIGRALRRNFHVSMNAAPALGDVINWNSGTKGQAAVITARAFSFLHT